MKLIEVQVDRLVGPTHHFGGLGVGNVASAAHAGEISHPAAAAIAGLDKMRLVARLGVPQWILPPQPRPNRAFLRSLGFRDGQPLRKVLTDSPRTFSAANSSSAMWTANAATVCPAVDSTDGATHITVANLISSLHRAIEPEQTREDLEHLFSQIAEVHPPLAGGAAMRDEGAANHMRLGAGGDRPGLHLFVHGDGQPAPQKYWPRQTRSACRAVARTLALDPERVFYLKQSARAIDAGAFHNDVVAASHEGLLLYHEAAFETPSQLDQVSEKYEQLYDAPLRRIVVSESELPLSNAIGTYLFNSQIVSIESSDAPVMICPVQVQSDPQAARLVNQWKSERVFSEVHFVNLNESMWGGGGPACLRLRVPVSEEQLAQIPAHARWTESLDSQLRKLIEETYPKHLMLAELADNTFVRRAERTQRQLVEILRDA